MRLQGWGRYPVLEGAVQAPASHGALAALLTAPATPPLIARGLGRSYGDSALAPLVVSSAARAMLLGFDEHSGVLSCEAGVSLAEILAVVVPRGWFLPVTPGTRFVTVGGAIASDVHGKNHHLHGCFSAHLHELELMLADGSVVRCSAALRPELFRATCGGMGLTGIILSARLQLRPMPSSQIEQRTLRAPSLEAVCALFEAHADSTYSVAWIDCLSRGAALGRSLLMLGEHGAPGADAAPPRRLSVPCDGPASLLNRYTMRAFNTLYYHAPRPLQQRLHYEKFFYPLDGVAHWNRLYGRHGFVQYQCVLPDVAGVAGLRALLAVIADSGRGSFLAVLKRLGAHNGNYLSFPLAGYTLALDFKVEAALFPLLERLDALVLDYGGRLYLAKDSRMSAATFQRSYPQQAAFQRVRAEVGALGHFASMQSERIGL
jgi:decaprenylphospho-beta-D-ribofuranose 2-oxidase